ncbi:glycine oxidase [Caulobacter ginsengisoli]|uniref:Glycine oxidase n=1 Tax=Caulobacter ginsengisoli TaxID=400775 RepID=A0ABU0IKY8_9CAUL|nr:FAD-dependent oxidoreductase [Caulobacter ginsengisoli]MDQ0462687.1 glycine oxidase [Caulobacter ginsengisoli]
MQRLSGIGVTVAGAGALGLSIAVELARAGAEVTVCDPAPLGDNASGVAAGMLAPAFEALLDPVSAGRFPLFKAARDLWPDFAASLDLKLERSGAILTGAGEGELARLLALGARGSLAPAGLYTPEDWRLDPLAALTAMSGVAIRQEAVTQPDGLTIVATGAEIGLAPELTSLTPIKGHILRYSGGPAGGPVLRGAGIYVCPDPNGAIAGATMEVGVSDRGLSPARGAILQAKAEALVPALAGLTPTLSAGVRAATPDGLPLVGWSAREGVFVAAGARRNGWLLAPLVARMTAAYLAGEDPGPWADAMNPRRFEETT